MKTPFLTVAAVSVATLGGCACNQPEAVQVDAQPAMTSQAWRLNHQLTAERRAENPQPEFERAEADDPASQPRPRGTRQDVWVINDALLKLAGDGSFESHFMLAEGGSFAVDGEWQQQSVAGGTLIELDPRGAVHYVPSSTNPNAFVDSCVILIDESGRRMRLMGIGLPDLVLTPIP